MRAREFVKKEMMAPPSRPEYRDGQHSLDFEDTVTELNLNQTLDFIKQAHGDQLYGKLPYWRHPRAVAMTGKKIFGSKFTSDAVKVAFLHDVVEDTDIGLDQLAKLDFSPEVIKAVGLLTKDKSINYNQNIDRIINSGSMLAMMVKFADNWENFHGDKSDWDPKRASSSQKKYLASLTRLGQVLGVEPPTTENLIPYPKGTVKVDVDDVYDWYKLGQNIADLDDADPKEFGKGPPQTVLSFGSEPIEHKYLKQLKRLRMPTHDIDEGWRDWLGGAAIGAAVGLGGAHGTVKDITKSQTQIQQPAEKPSAAPVMQNAQPEVKPSAVPKKSVTGSPHEKILTKAAVDAGITGQELAAFLAQTAHETGNFEYMKELGGRLDFKKYEPVFKKDKHKKIIIDPSTGKPKNFNAKAARLGNDQLGDGVRYRGRGYIQLTGKYNYQKAGRALGLDLVNKPELVERPEIAAKVAVWFWQNRVQPKVDDFDNTRAVTKPINSGLKGLADREEKFKSFKVAMK